MVQSKVLNDAPAREPKQASTKVSTALARVITPTINCTEDILPRVAQEQSVAVLEERTCRLGRRSNRLFSDYFIVQLPVTISGFLSYYLASYRLFGFL